MFYGLGIPENKSKAITYWNKAITLGHIKSECHLCHAYTDKKEPTYNSNLVKIHCKKALLICRGMDEKDEEALRVIEDFYTAVKYYKKLLNGASAWSRKYT